MADHNGVLYINWPGGTPSHVSENIATASGVPWNNIDNLSVRGIADRSVDGTTPFFTFLHFYNGGQQFVGLAFDADGNPYEPSSSCDTTIFYDFELL